MPEKEDVCTPGEAKVLLRRAGLLPPQTLTLAITGTCNLRCSHCWVEGFSTCGNVEVDLLRRLIAESAELEMEAIRFTGGEPLLHPHWQDVLFFARACGFSRIHLQTNGVLIREEVVAILREADFPGLSIEISLDGAGGKSHDRVRGAGTFEGALEGIRRLAQAGLGRRIRISFTEMQHNLHEFPDLLSLAADLGVGSVVGGALVLCGRAADTPSLAPATAGEYRTLLQRFQNDPLFRSLYHAMGSMAALEWVTKEASRSAGCSFLENPYLTPRGVLYPCLLCHADDFAVAGVFEKGLAEAIAEGVPLWSDLLRLSRSRPATIGRCRECSEKLSCAGGCMGRAWGSRSDLLAPDDRCDVRIALCGLKNPDSSRDPY